MGSFVRSWAAPYVVPLIRRLCLTVGRRRWRADTDTTRRRSLALPTDCERVAAGPGSLVLPVMLPRSEASGRQAFSDATQWFVTRLWGGRGSRASRRNSMRRRPRRPRPASEDTDTGSMRVLLLHPDDSPRQGPWSRQRWDLIVDLGKSSTFSQE